MKIGKKTLRVCAGGVLALALITGAAAQRAFAAQRDIGRHSKAEIRAACNAAGGELLGVSEFGSYGCEVADKDTMILCNKNEECTAYTPARTKSDRNHILNVLKLKVKIGEK